MTTVATGPPRTASHAGELKRLVDAVVMMVDDESLNIEMTRVHLEDAGYTNFVSTDDPKEALAMVLEHRPDVLLLDLMMPGLTGFDILERLGAEDLLKDVPVLVLTASADAPMKLRALELGATDLLAKPVDPSELVLRLKNTLAAKAYRDRLAHYDLLTGLPNRQAFVARLDWAIRLAQRQGHQGAVLQLGLDDFRQVNEALGPGVGDTVLQRLAQRLERTLRATDLVGRMGREGEGAILSRLTGDEFTILLPVLRRGDDAVIVAQRVRQAVAEPLQVADHELALSASVGIALLPQDGAQSDDLLRSAGSAMHAAKAGGGHGTRFYSSELNARAVQRLSVVAELRRALERDELVVHYQPKVDIGTGRVAGAEALVRWQHPHRGLLPPSEFVEVAEESGLVVPLGEAVLRIVCRQVAAWATRATRVPRISVNVSSHQFRQVPVAALVRDALTDTGARGEHLCVELTEGAMFDSAQSNVETLQALKAMGLRISLDDFGTGFSSLSYLHRFPLDELKIDRSFVMQLARPGDRSPIISAIIAMAHSLGLRVVAEGVETESQLDFLAAQRCDEYQGYLCSKPVPAAEFEARFLGA